MVARPFISLIVLELSPQAPFSETVEYVVVGGGGGGAAYIGGGGGAGGYRTGQTPVSGANTSSYYW